ncbi:MAG: prepilin-type N-terminal cleavage/methylation domain-containing protein [Gemmataceae bacterium]
MIRHAAPRRGFTLVELLVVIAIIAVLASLLVVTVVKVKTAADNATVSSDIAQIASAISTYKSKMNVGYIPSCGAGGTGGGLFRLRSLYAGNEPEAVYLKQVWPQLPGCTGVKTETTGLPDADLDCNQTLVFFLTGGDVTDFQGFSTNRTNPFTKVAVGSTESRIGPFLTFPAKRYAPGTAVAGADKRFSSLLDAFGSPYAYFAFNPYVNTYKAPDPKTGAYTVEQGFAFNGTPVTPYQSSPGKYLEPKGFQIISAGSNGKDDPTTPNTFGFGPGGLGWTPGSGAYAEGMAGADDIANFNGNGKLISQK